jgi:predicted transcriptional regulator
MTSRQTLHQLIDTLDEDFVRDLIERIESETTRDIPLLTHDSLKSIARGLAQAAAGEGVPHEDAMRSVGLDP